MFRVGIAYAVAAWIILQLTDVVGEILAEKLPGRDVDADEQRVRFEEELDRIEQREGARPQMPEKFLEDLARLDRAAGIAFGLDRLLMLLLSADSIKQAVSFSPDQW